MIPKEAALLRVYLNASDSWNHQPLYRAVVETARARHIAGASAFLVDLSYGAHRQIHDARSEYESFDIPIVIDFVDAPEKIAALREELGRMVGEGLMVTRPVHAVQYICPTRPGPWDGGTASSSARKISPRTTAEGVAMTTIEGEARRVTIYIGSADTWHGQNLSAAIIEHCRAKDIAGATASLGVLGFGKTSRIHRAHLLGLSEDLPERIEIIDSPERIAQILPTLEEMVQGGLIVVEDVEAVRYRHDPGKPTTK